MLILEMVNYKNDNYVYIEGIPAFRLCSNGEKDSIIPDGWTMYWNNKEFVDEWLKNQVKNTPPIP